MALKTPATILRLRRIAVKFARLPNVLGVGVGLAYSERKNRWSGKPITGKSPHWTNWAIKVLVRKKDTPKDAIEIIPRHICLLVGGKKFKFRVDVVEVGKRWPTPRLLQLQSGGDLPSFSNQDPRPGRQIRVRTCPKTTAHEVIVGSKPRGCSQNVGTIGWLGKNQKGHPYIITAAHVIDSVYPPTPSGALLRDKRAALIFDKNGSGFQYPSSRPPFVVPTSVKLPNGRVVDASGLRLPFSPDFSKRIRVPDLVTLYKFVGSPAHILVERNGNTTALPGVIEEILEPSTHTFSHVSAALPRLIALRFRDQRTTVPGDSGAPVLVRREKRLYLLGFHFVEVDRKDNQKDFRTRSFSIPAQAAFRNLRLRPYYNTA